MKCGTLPCTADAVCLARWPGRDIVFCEACAARAQSIARAMGFEVVVRPLEESADYWRAAREARGWLGDTGRGDD